MTHPSLINLHPNEYRQKSYSYTFIVKLAWCVRSCKTLDDFSNKVQASDKTEDLNPSCFNMITRINH